MMERKKAVYFGLQTTSDYGLHNYGQIIRRKLSPYMKEAQDNIFVKSVHAYYVKKYLLVKCWI